AGISRVMSQNAVANPCADQDCSWRATPEPERKCPSRLGCAKIIRLARYTLDADGLPLVSVKLAMVNPAFTIASIDIIDPPPPAPWKPTSPLDSFGAAGANWAK